MSLHYPELTAETRSFAPGYLDEPEGDTLPRGASADARNCFLRNLETQDKVRAILRRKPGSRLVNPTAIASGKPVTGLWEFPREGAARELVALCNGTLTTFDGVDDFDAITDGTGFDDADLATAARVKNNLVVSDGTQMLRYDGTSALPVGFAAPTAAPGLADGGAGSLPAGTWEGYAVWVDAATGHLSSPSAVSSPLTLGVSKSRQWTKPTGSPPANVTHWRVYSRRTDTDENEYYRTGLDQTVATATYTEDFLDDARTEVGPSPNSNDEPPGAFAAMAEYKGHLVGVLPDSSIAHVSKQGDFESWHPRDQFPIGGRGEASAVHSVNRYRQDLLLQKGTLTYRFVGDRVPFVIEPVHSSFGNVHSDAGMEVDGRYFGWDEQRGPYVMSDLAEWRSLAAGRIQRVVDAVNRDALASIRVQHYQAASLVVWAVPTTSSRKRTLLAYNYLLDRWLPPMTGLEYVSLATFTTADGELGLYCGDEWGRVYELFDGEVEGVPSGDTTATITGATADTITASGAAFYTTGDGLAGMPVAVRSPTGSWQWARVESNTGTEITLDTTNGPDFAPVPDPDDPLGAWTVIVGGIEGYWTSRREHFGLSRMKKRGGLLVLEGSAVGLDDVLEVLLTFDGGAQTRSYDIQFPLGGLVWDVGSWDEDEWSASGARSALKKRVSRVFRDVTVRLQNYYPNQPFEISELTLTADRLARRGVPSA